ncbi:MAG: tetratricopeptide repeat protein [Crocosphaera sp.]
MDMRLLSTKEDQETYEALRRNLQRRKGFGLLFVCCTPVEEKQIISQLQVDLPNKKIDVLKLNSEIDNIYQLIEDKLEKKKLNHSTYVDINSEKNGSIDVLMIQGIEKSFINYIKPGIGGQGDYYKLDNLPPLLGHLNLQRERFRDNFNIPLVFFVPPFGLRYLLRRAPDFFDWRSGLFKFIITEDLLLKESRQMIDQGNYNQYRHLTPQERYQKMNEIKDLIDDFRQKNNTKADLWCEIGILYTANKDYEEALSAFENVLEIKPNNVDAWYNRGYVLDKLGSLEEAISSFDKTLEIKPDYYEAWNNRGIALDNLERLEEALSSYNKALKIQPHYLNAWYNQALALNELGRFDEALSSYAKALGIKSDDHNAWINRGNALYNLGRLEEAITSYHKALTFQPDDHEAWYNQALALDELRRFDEAITCYDKALEIKPHYVNAWYNKALALNELGRFDKAIASFDKTLEFKPNFHLAWINRGYALDELGRFDEAIASFDQALEMKPYYVNTKNKLTNTLNKLKNHLKDEIVNQT